MALKTTFRDKTKNLLINRPASLELATISKNTGLHKNWLSMFAQGHIKEPSVNRIETLHDYLIETYKTEC